VGARCDVQSDASIFLAEPLGTEGIVLSAGVLPRYADVDTYHMTASVIDLAIRRIVAVGGKLGHVAGLDNFCWPDPVQSDKTPDGHYKLAQLVRANQALYDYTTAFDVPCISGKDSMKNDSTRGGKKISIPPTLLFSAIAKMDDVSQATTLAAKRSGDLVYVLGNTRAELGGSEYYAMLDATGNTVPTVDAAKARRLYDALAAANAAGCCHSIPAPSLGGLGVGFAKVAVGGRLGLDVDLDTIPAVEGLSQHELLFSESNTRFIVTVCPKKTAEFEELLAGNVFACVGKVTVDPTLTFRASGAFEFDLSLDALRGAYVNTLANQ
jgi:phosphoribosylformylglycinamidine synthase